MTTLTGSDVRELRERRGWSVSDLAGILGIEDHEVRLLEVNDSSYLTNLEEALVLLGAVPGAGGPVTVVEPTPEPPTPVQEEPRPVAVPFDGATRRFSNSELRTFKRCRRKWWLGWYRGLVPDEPVVGPLAIGNRMHRALEVAYAPGGPFLEKGRTALEMFIKQDREAMGVVDDVTAAQFESEANLERIMLDGYAEWVQETGVDADIEVIAAEQYVEAPLSVNFMTDVAVMIIGKLDVIIRRTTDGAMSFIDHKTMAAFGTALQMLNLDEQSRHYQLLQWMTTPQDQRVAGIVFNMLRKVKRTARATPPFYAREAKMHNRITMENYYDRLMGEIKDVLDVERRLREGTNHQLVAYPSPDNRCTWDCPFFKVCDMFDDGSRVEDAVSAHFKVGNPLHYYDRDKEGANDAVV